MVVFSLSINFFIAKTAPTVYIEAHKLNCPGEVTEWLKVHAWNACVRKYREFESHPLRHALESPVNEKIYRVFYFRVADSLRFDVCQLLKKYADRF